MNPFKCWNFRLVGDFRNAGREWHPSGSRERVRAHDFKDAELGKAIPYGSTTWRRTAGRVSVGADHDTASFAVETLRSWWLGWGARGTRRRGGCW